MVVKTLDTIILLSQRSMGVTGELTSVSGARTNVYFLMISMRAILASMRANLIPMQLRGPQPKGMWQTLGRFAFSSGVNLRKRGREELINQPNTGRKEFIGVSLSKPHMML